MLDVSEKLFESCLLIEDDPSHALLVKRAVAGFLGKVTHCETFSSALEVLKEDLPDLVITDLNLPDAKRIENVSRIRAEFPHIPVIVLTSSTSLEDAVQAMKLGARDFIVKNFDSSFREMIRLSLSRLYASMAMESERRKMQREMDALRAAIENSNDGLAVTDGQGRVVYANRSFLKFGRMCGGEPESIETLIGSKVESAIRLSAAIIEKFRVLSAGAVWHTEVKFVGDKNCAYDLSLSVIRPEDCSRHRSEGSNECVLWVRDVTEEKRREKFQREILSTTTHDLKGPLGAISLSAEVLQPLVSENQRAVEVVRRIASSSLSAINMIDEFLSARRIKEGTFVLKPSVCDVASAVKEIVEGFEPAAGVKNLTVLVSAEPERVEWRVDRPGFLRVVSNLLSNAIKFTPKGGRVKMSISRANEDLHVVVSDNGSGMEPSEVNRIFERFTRLEKHADIPGSGIGLFVVKSIVRAHGGRIEVTSQPGQGTTFDIVFPENPPVNDRGELYCLDFA